MASTMYFMFLFISMMNMVNALNFVDIPSGPAVAAATDPELIGVRVLMNNGTKPSSTVYCSNDEFTTVGTKSAQLMYSTTSTGTQNNSVRSRELPNCSYLCQGFTPGTCGFYYSGCRGWRRMNVVKETTEIAEETDVRMLESAVAARCVTEKQAIKDALISIYGTSSVSSNCKSIMQHQISLECLVN